MAVSGDVLLGMHSIYSCRYVHHFLASKSAGTVCFVWHGTIFARSVAVHSPASAASHAPNHRVSHNTHVSRNPRRGIPGWRTKQGWQVGQQEGRRGPRAEGPDKGEVWQRTGRDREAQHDKQSERRHGVDAKHCR